MTEMEKQVFEPGELFIYRRVPGVYELGVVKRDRGDGTYACYYSTGETAAVTPTSMMCRLINANWAPIQWADIWGGKRLTLDDLLHVIPEKHVMSVSQNDAKVYVGLACHVPHILRGLRVTVVRSSGWMVDVEVYDG